MRYPNGVLTSSIPLVIKPTVNAVYGVAKTQCQFFGSTAHFSRARDHRSSKVVEASIIIDHRSSHTENVSVIGAGQDAVVVPRGRILGTIAHDGGLAARRFSGPAKDMAASLGALERRVGADEARMKQSPSPAQNLQTLIGWSA